MRSRIVSTFLRWPLQSRRAAEHVVRHRRRRHPEQVLQDPFSSHHGRRPVGMGRHHQHRPLAENSPARVIGQRDPPEVTSVDTWYPVVSCEPFVDEGVIRVHQIEDAAVFLNDALKEEQRFLAERAAQIVVEVDELRRQRRHVAEVPEIQPLPCEVRRERRRLGIGQHAPDLRAQHTRFAEFGTARDLQQLVVRNPAPQEERQTRGQSRSLMR